MPTSRVRSAECFAPDGAIASAKVQMVSPRADDPCEYVTVLAQDGREYLTPGLRPTCWATCPTGTMPGADTPTALPGRPCANMRSC